MPTTKYVIYFNGTEFIEVYTRNEVSMMQWIAEEMGYKFKMEEVQLWVD